MLKTVDCGLAEDPARCCSDRETRCGDGKSEFAKSVRKIEDSKETGEEKYEMVIENSKKPIAVIDAPSEPGFFDLLNNPRVSLSELKKLLLRFASPINIVLSPGQLACFNCISKETRQGL